MCFMPKRRATFPVGTCAVWNQGCSGQRYRVTVIEHLGRRSLRIQIDEVIKQLPERHGVSLLAPGDEMIILARNLRNAQLHNWSGRTERPRTGG